MNDWNESVTMWDEDDLDNLCNEIREKVYSSWKAGYQAEVDVNMSFDKVEEGE